MLKHRPHNGSLLWLGWRVLSPILLLRTEALLSFWPPSEGVFFSPEPPERSVLGRCWWQRVLESPLAEEPVCFSNKNKQPAKCVRGASLHIARAIRLPGLYRTPRLPSQRGVTPVTGWNAVRKRVLLLRPSELWGQDNFPLGHGAPQRPISCGRRKQAESEKGSCV